MATRRTDFSLAQTVAVLERTPAALLALLAGAPEALVRATEGDGTWSPHDVVGHLVHAERTNWIPRARHILAGEQRPFDPFDREGQRSMEPHEALEERLAAFAEARRENLAILRGMDLGDADLGRTGNHPEFGRVTLAELLATWAVHDLTHLAQIVRTMAKVHSAAVGPWSAYLSILRDRAPVSHGPGGSSGR